MNERIVSGVPMPEKHIFENQPELRFFDLEEKDFDALIENRVALKKYESLINEELVKNRGWWLGIIKKYNIDPKKEEWIFNEEKKRIELKNILQLKSPMPDKPLPEPLIRSINERRDILQEGSVSNLEHLTKQPQAVFRFIKAEYPPEEEGGGIYIHLDGLKYPTKGFPFPDACQAANIVKRMFIGQVRFLAKHPLSLLSFIRKKVLGKWLREMCSVAEIALEQYYLKDYRYIICCREIRKFIEKFLAEWKIPGAPDSLAKNLIHLIEFDDAYRFRIQDLANETSVEKLMADPIGEINRLLQILKQRDPRPGMSERFGSLLFLLKIAFKISGAKKAFLLAIKSIDLSKIQMDEADRYQVLRWRNYDFLGQTFEERMKQFIKIHEGKMPRVSVVQS